MKPITLEQTQVGLFRMVANGFRIIHPDGTDMTTEIVLKTPLRIIELALGEEEEDGSPQQQRSDAPVPEGTEGDAAPTAAA